MPKYEERQENMVNTERRPCFWVLGSSLKRIPWEHTLLSPSPSLHSQYSIWWTQKPGEPMLSSSSSPRFTTLAKNSPKSWCPGPHLQGQLNLFPGDVAKHLFFSNAPCDASMQAKLRTHNHTCQEWNRVLKGKKERRQEHIKGPTQLGVWENMGQAGSQKKWEKEWKAPGEMQ